jgi:pyruvate dehydrogenase (quinone)
VFRNGALGFVELEMKSIGILDFATDRDNPSFARIAGASGLLGLSVETPEQVRPALEQAFAHDGPALVRMFVNRQELAMPSTITFDQVRGFGLFMIRAVLNGRGDELIDLARTNLLR